MSNRTTRLFSREAARSLREFYSSQVSLLGSSRLTSVRVTFSSFFAIPVCFVSLLAFFFFFLIYFWLHWVFVAVGGLSLVAASRATLRCGVWTYHCGGFSCCGAEALSAWASVVVARGLSCSTACGTFRNQGSNPCPLHRQADS